MNHKKLIITIVSLMMAVVIGIAALLFLYKYKPQYLGLPMNPQDSIAQVEEERQKLLIAQMKAKENPKVNISLDEFNRMQSQLLKNAILRHQNESIKKQKDYLYDSLKHVSSGVQPARDSLAMLKDSFQISRNYIEYLNDSLNKLSAMYNSAIKTNDQEKKAKAKAKEDEAAKAKAKAEADSLRIKNLTQYAKIYNASNPREVARILEQLDEKDAAFIIKNMNKKKAAKVLESMLPEEAAAIMLLGGK